MRSNLQHIVINFLCFNSGKLSPLLYDVAQKLTFYVWEILLFLNYYKDRICSNDEL
jgi:hypothetical protein